MYVHNEFHHYSEAIHISPLDLTQKGWNRKKSKKAALVSLESKICT